MISLQGMGSFLILLHQFIQEVANTVILLMEEILHQLICFSSTNPFEYDLWIVSDAGCIKAFLIVVIAISTSKTDDPPPPHQEGPATLKRLTTCSSDVLRKKRSRITGFLVGGFNPFEKYQSKWESSPNRGEKKNIWNHHPDLHGPYHHHPSWLKTIFMIAPPILSHRAIEQSNGETTSVS